MIDQTLTTITKLFSRRFIMAQWVPAFLFTHGVFGIAWSLLGWERIYGHWQTMSVPQQGFLALLYFLAVTLLAWVMDIFTYPIVRLHEGYLLPEYFAEYGRNKHRQRRQNLFTNSIKQVKQDRQKFNHFYYDYYQSYPRKRLLPTALGNVLAAAEEYPQDIYSIDAVIWWPRLLPLLPEDFRAQIDAAITPMLSMLNLALLSALLGLGGSLAVALNDRRVWLYLLVFGLGLLLWRAFYQAAVQAAYGYGNYVRAAFDLYRWEIFKAINVPFPLDHLDESHLWTVLNRWIYLRVNPNESINQLINQMSQVDESAIKRLRYRPSEKSR
jgi:hypothetical protein